MFSRKAAGFAGALLIIGGISGALSRWYLVWLAQELGGAEALGAYGLLFAVATPLFVAAQLGLRTLLLSKKIAYPWRSYLVLRLTGLSVGVLVLGLFVLYHPAVSLSLGLSVLVLKVVDGINDLHMARIQFAGRIQTMAVLLILAVPLTLIFSTLGAIAFRSLAAAVAGAALASFVTGLFSIFISYRLSYEADGVSRGFRDILSSSIPVTSGEILASVLLYIPVWVLGVFADISVVGIFAGIAYVLTAADLIGSSISKILITPLRNLGQRSGSISVVRKVNFISIWILLIGVPIGGVFMLVGSPLFQWIYGPEFSVSPIVLCLFAAGCVFVILSHVQSVCLNVLNRYYRVAVSFAVACISAFGSGMFLLILGVESLVVGSAMVAVGSFSRVATMYMGVFFVARRDFSVV